MFELNKGRNKINLFKILIICRWVAEEDQVVNFPTVRMKGGMPIRVIRKKQPVQMQ